MYIQVSEDNYVLCITSEESVDKSIFKEVEEVPEIVDEENKIKRHKYNPEDNTVYIEVEDILIPTPEPIVEENPTLEEMQAQILLNTEYLVIMSELANM